MNKKKGLQYEKRIIKFLKKEFGMEVSGNINSGAYVFDKGDLTATDIDGETYLVEVKGTSKKSFRLTSEHLSKVFEDSFEKLQQPLFCILCDGLDNYKVKVAVITKIKLANSDSVNEDLKKSINLKFQELEDGEVFTGIIKEIVGSGFSFKCTIYEHRR